MAESRINKEEIITTYLSKRNVYTTEITGMGEDAMETVTSSFISDAKVLDAIRFLEIYLEEQLVEPGKAGDGSVELSVIYFNEKTRMNAGSILGVLTIGVANLLGVPYATAVAEVEIEAAFLDNGAHKIAGHRGVGKGRKLLFLYNSSQRKAHQRALKDAIRDLNMNILMDPLLMERTKGIP